MIRHSSTILLVACAMLLPGCNRQEATEVDDAEWSDVRPMADAVEPGSEAPSGSPSADGEDYAPLIRRLEEMVSVVRAAGETMITGESLILDYERRFVRLDQGVRVVDDHGVLETETLMGRFSENHAVEMVEARKGVRIVSGERLATAERATYEFLNGAIVLEGDARLSEGGKRLSGDQIRFWLKGSRRMVCEPDALLEIAAAELEAEGLGSGGETTEIRADRVVFDEEQTLAEFDGNVRLRDSRAALNSGKVKLHLKENNKIDWIEALSDVIIRTDTRKALAGRASYYADQKKFVLEGDPRVMEGRNILAGDRITLWQEPRRMVCEPNARVLLYPDEAMKKKFLEDLSD